MEDQQVDVQETVEQALLKWVEQDEIAQILLTPWMESVQFVDQKWNSNMNLY